MKVACYDPTQMSSTRQKLPQLDVLRGLCALIVALHHVEFQAPFRDAALLRHGALFVDFFFVLSGFIISYNYANLTTLPELGRFMGLRFARVYPLHLVMLFVFTVYEAAQWLVSRALHITLQSAPFSDNDALGFLLNLSLLNGVGLRTLSFNIPSWSISSEFWTYLSFGLVMTTLAGRTRLHSWAFATVALLALGVLVFGTPTPGLTEDWRFFFPRCLFSFFLGALLCSGWTQIGPRAARWGKASIGVWCQLAALTLAVTVVSLAWPEVRPLEFAAPFSFVLVIAAFVLWPESALVRALLKRPLLWLGEVSYSIYMVHMIVLLAIEAVLRLVLHARYDNTHGIVISHVLGAVLMVVYLGSVLLLAALSRRFIEDPGRELGRELLRPRRAPSPAQSVP